MIRSVLIEKTNFLSLSVLKLQGDEKIWGEDKRLIYSIEFVDNKIIVVFKNSGVGGITINSYVLMKGYEFRKKLSHYKFDEDIMKIESKTLYHNKENYTIIDVFIDNICSISDKFKKDISKKGIKEINKRIPLVYRNLCLIERDLL